MWRTKNKFSAHLTALAEGGGEPPLASANKGAALKKYLVVKVAEGFSHVVNWIAMPGLYTLEAAQQFVDSATANEPGATFLIQEVGTA
jgi:hypothetical protein